MPRPTSLFSPLISKSTLEPVFSAPSLLYPPPPLPGLDRGQCDVLYDNRSDAIAVRAGKVVDTLTRSSAPHQTHPALHKTVSTTTLRSPPDTHRISSALTFDNPHRLDLQHTLHHQNYFKLGEFVICAKQIRDRNVLSTRNQLNENLERIRGPSTCTSHMNNLCFFCDII